MNETKLNYTYLGKLKQEDYSASKSYYYSIRCLNNSIRKFQCYINDPNTSETNFNEEEAPYLSTLSEQFLDLVENAKDYYDAKAHYEKVHKEYELLSKILDLNQSISDYIRWISNANYTDYNEPLEKDYDELMDIIRSVFQYDNGK